MLDPARNRRGVAVVLAITALTGYFVAQEFAYMAVDRVPPEGARPIRRRRRGPRPRRHPATLVHAVRRPTRHTPSPVCSSALRLAEPLIGRGLGELMGGIGIPTGVGIAVGAILAVLFSTVVQMVFGELFPKNLAIARPDPSPDASRCPRRSTSSCSAG
ncbi:DUF21 domain-containing protein [Rhodococcus hoagii]|nr:DUF21 domain-containing protein [Prescottella equi]